jgi:hypothetical protein
MAFSCSNFALNGPPFKTLCALPAKLGQSIWPSLPKRSAAWQSFASGRITSQRRGRALHWAGHGTMGTAKAFMEMETGSVNLTVVITLTGNSFFCLIKRKVYAIA